MKIRSLWLEDFRNYPAALVEPGPGVNLFCGANGQGKTNLLEAVALLSHGSSFRGARDSVLARLGSAGYRVAAEVARSGGSVRVEVAFSPRHGKRAQVGGVAVDALRDLSGVLCTVLFTPDHLGLMKGDPRGRRAYLDTQLVQVSAFYRHHLLRLRRVVLQRNRLLADWHTRGPGRVAELEAWNDELLAVGVRIMAKRAEALARLAPLVREAYAHIARGREELEVEYVPFFRRQEDAGPERKEYGEAEIARGFREALERRAGEEVRRGVSLVGPHRDDLRFTLSGLDLRTFGSQGQQRSAVLAVTLAFVRFLGAEMGEEPVLLLDDVLSELDPERRAAFLAALPGGLQVLVTLTGLEGLAGEEVEGAAVYEVREGSVRPWRDRASGTGPGARAGGESRP